MQMSDIDMSLSWELSVVSRQLSVTKNKEPRRRNPLTTEN
jgi:hypothetical protein